MNGVGPRILIVAPSWVGDAVLSQPLLALLKARQPDAAIDVFAPSWVLPVYRRMPEVAGTLENPFGHGALALGARLRYGRRLRERCYARAVILPNSLKSALVPYFAAIAQRTGFVGELRYGLLNDARRLDEARMPLMVERFAYLAGEAGEPLLRPVPRPRLRVTGEETQQVLAAKALQRPERLACFCPGAEYGPAKRWPAAHFAQLARHLARQSWKVWLLGSSKDVEAGTQIVRQAGDAVLDLTGKTSLDEAVALLAIADLVVTNDSGLMHVAAALDRPLVAIYGSSSPRFTPPLSEHARIVQLGVPCSPCFQRVCPLGHFDCMMRLAPERILREIEALGCAA
ncbi:MAG TPA: lipopolysaccharide heptosyltransferase II [Burkholderiales bacterium]|nr:lipopolysaccharide heptosyltransferase II [Burkholderiales bacterium]